MQTQTMQYGPSTIPVVAEVDVIVVGGGTSGFPAAVAAARMGAQTMIVEAQNCLGGTVTAGLMEGYIGSLLDPIRKQDRGGIFREVWDRMQEMGGVVADPERPDINLITYPASLGFGGFDPEILKIVASRIAREENVETLYYTNIADTIVEDGVVSGIVIVNRAGLQAIKAKVVVDTSGDGNAAAFGGASFASGRETDNQHQAVTLDFRIGGVDESRIPEDRRATLIEAVRRAREAGDLRLPPHVGTIRQRWMDQSIGGGRTTHPGIFYMNLDMAIGVETNDPLEVSRTIDECRELALEHVSFLRKYVPGYEQAYLIDTASLLGIRDSRRIIGEYVLTGEDIRSGRKFLDTIANSQAYIDLHGPERPPKHSRPRRDDWYDIPYRCLVAVGLDNILVAGRCISSDFAAQSGVRLVPAAVATGQAAGVAAALAANAGVTTRTLDVTKIQEGLVEQGVQLSVPIDEEVAASEDLSRTFAQRPRGRA